MGEGNSKPAINQPFVQNFKVEHQVVQESYDDPRLGRVDIYKHNSGQEYVAVKKSFSHNKGLVEQCQQRLVQALQNLSECPYLLKVLGFDSTDDQAMCGSVSEMQTYHEYYLNNLEAEVQQRQQSSLFYSEPELWVILYSCISSVNFLAKYDKNINDIRPQNIYITPNGQLKLVPFELFPEDIPGFLKVQHYNDQCYISPSQLQEVRENQTHSNKDKFKADIYAIGLTILQCATLHSSVDCYDWDNLLVRSDTIEQRIQMVRERYSRFFSNMVKILLEQSDENRPSSQKIAQVLEPYEYQILNLQPFMPNQEIIMQHLNQDNVQQEQIIQQQPQQYQQQPEQFQNQPIQQQIIPQQQSQVLPQQPLYNSQNNQLANNIQSQYTPQTYLNQSQVQYQQVQQAPINNISNSQVLQQQQSSQQKSQTIPLQPSPYRQQSPLQQQPIIQSQVVPEVQQQLQNPKPIKFEDLPIEVQNQIKRGEKGTIKIDELNTQTQKTQAYQQPVYQQPVPMNQPQVGEYQQVSQPPKEVIQQRSYDPQSPIRLVQGPQYEQNKPEIVQQQAQPVQIQYQQQPQIQQTQDLQQLQGYPNNQTQHQQPQQVYEPQQPQQTYQTQQQYSQYQPVEQQQQYQQPQNEMTDIDQRINDVLNKTKSTLERVEQQNNY